MSSSRYLELLKSKHDKLLKVLDLYESGVGSRSDYVMKHLCDSDNVPFNHSKDAVLKLSFKSEVKLECPNKRLIKLKDLCCGKYLLCSAPDCDYKCRSPWHMARHAVVHSGEKPFKCRDCKYATKWKHTLKEHQFRMHSKNTGCSKVFVCEFEGCNFRTTLSSNAVEHRRRHLKIKPFKCYHPDCGLSFVRQSCLQQHKVVHAKKKRFRCMQKNCNFATKHRHSLKLHQASHSSVRAFKCPHNNCTYAAKQRNTFRDHLVTHSEAKPYKCDFKHCNYASNSKRCLKSHRFVHSEFRLFKCDYENCSYAAKQKTSLFRHKKSHERKRAGKGEK